jgi:hypothetical protein
MAVTKVDGGQSGVQHPSPHDMALHGDTRHRLHTARLPKAQHLGHVQPSGPDPNQLRYDDGMGTGEADDNC